MADQFDTPLTDAERAELEALRAEKARRERAELEALRAEQEAAETAPTPAPAPQPQPSTAPTPVSAAPAPDSVEPDTFGRRMVLSQGEDEDGIPAMPPAQKITIGLCLVVAACVAGYFIMNNLGLL